MLWFTKRVNFNFVFASENATIKFVRCDPANLRIDGTACSGASNGKKIPER
jgi:hypothetical protein